MFPVTVTIHNLQQLNAVLSLLQGPVVKGSPEQTEPERPAKVEAEPTKVEAAPAPVTDDKPPTYQDAAAAVTALGKAKGREAAVALLKQFGAAKLPDVKPEQFGEVIAACAAARGE